MRAVVGVEIPGIPVGASVMLMQDGTWLPASGLSPSEVRVVDRWIRVLGDHFRLICLDMLSEERKR